MNSINTNIMALNPKNVINTFLGPVSIIIIIIQIITCVFLTLQAIKAYIAYSNAEDVTKKKTRIKKNDRSYSWNCSCCFSLTNYSSCFENS